VSKRDITLDVLITAMHDVDPSRFGLPPALRELESLVEFLTGKKVEGSLDQAVRRIAVQLRAHMPKISDGTKPPPVKDLWPWLIRMEAKYGATIKVAPFS
jgi:hypothetical protein